MKSEHMLMYALVFVLGFIVARMMGGRLIEGAAKDCPTDKWQSQNSCGDEATYCMGHSPPPMRGLSSEDFKTAVEQRSDEYRENGYDFVCNVSNDWPRTKNCIQLAYTHQTYEINCNNRNPCNKPCNRG